MITVTAKCNLLQGTKEEYKNRVLELISETRKEDGCIEYSLYEDVNSQDSICFIEKWESQEALDKHMKSQHFTRIVPMLRELQSEDSVVNIYREIKY